MTQCQKYDIENPEDAWEKNDPWVDFRYSSRQYGPQTTETVGEDTSPITMGVCALTISVKRTIAVSSIVEDSHKEDNIKAVEEVDISEERQDSTTGTEDTLPLSSVQSIKNESKSSLTWQDIQSNDDDEDNDMSSYDSRIRSNDGNENCTEEDSPEVSSEETELREYDPKTPHGLHVPSTGIWQDYLFCWNTRRIWQEDHYRPPQRTWDSIASLGEKEGLQIKGGKLTNIDILRHRDLGLKISQAAITEGEYQALKEPLIKDYRCQPSPLRLCVGLLSEDDQ